MLLIHINLKIYLKYHKVKYEEKTFKIWLTLYIPNYQIYGKKLNCKNNQDMCKLINLPTLITSSSPIGSRPSLVQLNSFAKSTSLPTPQGMFCKHVTFLDFNGLSIETFNRFGLYSFSTFFLLFHWLMLSKWGGMFCQSLSFLSLTDESGEHCKDSGRRPSMTYRCLVNNKTVCRKAPVKPGLVEECSV